MYLKLAPSEALASSERFESAGEYHRAVEALSDLWSGVGHPIYQRDLSSHLYAMLLLRAGSLTGWLGSTNQTGGTQEAAKDLLTRSIEIFSEIRDQAHIAEAEKCLSVCYGG